MIDQHGPGFEAQRRPLVRQEGHPVLHSRARIKVLSEAPSKPQGIEGNGGKIEYPVSSTIMAPLTTSFAKAIRAISNSMFGTLAIPTF